MQLSKTIGQNYEKMGNETMHENNHIHIICVIKATSVSLIYIQQYPISLCSKCRLYCATGGGRRNRKRCGLQRVGHVTDTLHAGGQRQRLQLCRWLRF